VTDAGIERPLPARSRGVIALLEENCTVCMLCVRACPDWCLVIEGHAEAEPGAAGQRDRSRNVLDRFAIDYGLCMYCGICVDVCPFDALFWAPRPTDSEQLAAGLTHERERLRGWLGEVPPPVPLDPGAGEPPELSRVRSAADRERRRAARR